MTAAELFSPVRLGPLALRNRVIVAPMTRARASQKGQATQEMASYYARYARHDVGLIVSEGTFVDERHSKAYFNQPGIATEAQQASWSKVVAGVHAEGVPMILQLQHAGRLAEPGLYPVNLGPSSEPSHALSWQLSRPYGSVRSAGEDDLDGIVAAFADAAGRAVAAGFDGVELHGARGYLLDGFLSASTNLRQDAYGQTLSGRLHLPLRVVRAVRERIGPALLSFNWSLYKMDDRDYVPPGGATEIEAIAEGLQEAGVDVLHISSRGAFAPVVETGPFARIVRRCVDVPVIAGGGLVTLTDAQQVLDEGLADAVALARALAANPDWVVRVRRGEPLEAFVRGVHPLPAEGSSEADRRMTSGMRGAA